MEGSGRKSGSPRSLLRRLRSLLPVSPLPWHWHKRMNRGMVLGIAALVAGGAVASVLIQRAGDDDPERAPKAAVAPPVKRELGRMSLKEKADEVVLAGIDAASPPNPGEFAPGGLFVGPDDWAAGGTRLVRGLRRRAGGRPPLIAGRQEGGIYRSYPDLPPPLTQLEVGAGGDPAAAEVAAGQAATAMRRAGFDLNLAPVADVAGLASPIADRAYGDDPELVSAMVAAAVRGCRDGGLACAVSHFPGLGGASADTLEGPATVSLDAASLDERDLVPFRAAAEAMVPAAVLSLAFYAAYDPVTPAALTPSIATGLLREDVGFEGVAISDDLTSGAVAAGLGAPEAAVQALAAGADMVLVDDAAQALAARDAILAAAKSGGLSGDRLDEAVGRVLDLKRERGLIGR
jgi:beta-N-acetylhexosaminidase